MTRHNVGFMVADRFCDEVSARLARHKRAHALAGEGRLGAPGTASAAHVVVLEPLSFMNESGGPIKAIAAFYDVPPEHMIVIHDELDIPFGDIRVKFGGGDNGHNGLRSIRRALGTGDFFRVRVGIGRPPGRQSPVDFVLKPYTSTERKDLPEIVDRASDAISSLIVDGLERTQSRFNASPQQG